MMAGEGAVKALTIISRKEFGPLKVAFDVTLVLTAIFLSFVCFGNVMGVGIGTVVSAICVGVFVKLLHSAYQRVAT